VIGVMVMDFAEKRRWTNWVNQSTADLAGGQRSAPEGRATTLRDAPSRGSLTRQPSPCVGFSTPAVSPRTQHQARYHSPPLRACASRDRELPKPAHQSPV
jgi:hypothetical protein